MNERLQLTADDGGTDTALAHLTAATHSNHSRIKRESNQSI